MKIDITILSIDRIFGYILIIITLLIIIGVNLISIYDDREYIYYFIYNGVEIKADYQEFNISYSGEINSCYFYKDGTKYSTCEYRKLVNNR